MSEAAGYELVISMPDSGTVRAELFCGGVSVARQEVPNRGHVDNMLLTAVDNMYIEHILDRFAEIRVTAGPGIDNYSLLDKIVLSLDAALGRARGGREQF
jgi:hypothetical protein